MKREIFLKPLLIIFTGFLLSQCTKSSHSYIKLDAQSPLTDRPYNIAGGAFSQSSIPWQVLVKKRVFNPAGGSLLKTCGGVVISPSHILTAGHCIHDGNVLLSPQAIEVWVGANHVDSLVPVEVRGLRPHGAYRTIKDRPNLNDIAIIELRYDLRYTQSIQPVSLSNSTGRKDELLEISGFGGEYEGGPNSRTLKSVVLPYVPSEVCRLETNYGNKISNDYFCSGVPQGGKDSCTGDSGGPVVRLGTNQLIGLTIWGEGCGLPKQPSVNIKISNYLTWISDTVGVRG